MLKDFDHIKEGSLYVQVINLVGWLIVFLYAYFGTDENGIPLEHAFTGMYLIADMAVFMVIGATINIFFYITGE